MSRSQATYWLTLLLFTALLAGIPYPSRSQTVVKRLFNRFFNDTTSSADPHVSFYPTISYAPETSVEIGVSALYLYHANNDVKHNRLSEIQAFSFVTLRGQYGLNIDHTIYGDRDRWFFLGRGRLQRFPLLYYGIGPDTKPDHPATIDAFSIQLRERAMRRIAPNLFGGIEVDYQRLSSVEFNQPEINTHTLPVGGLGTANLGFGVGFVYDSRPNVLNARRGAFAELAYLNYNRSRGSSLSFSNLSMDVRLFKTVRPGQVLAWQAYGVWANGNVPFNQLALLGSEIIMRGYYPGRFRDKAYAATQLEYRWLPFPFSRRFGGAVFAAVGTVGPAPGQIRLDKLLPTGGAGVRYLLFKKKDVYLRADVGVTQEGVGFYILTGEAF
ncbi:outer membrane protein assembly factor [Spirosoma sp. RP8]|uniref:Outer membrane protein assembly factor n=1 Tax=Spirosoma liriopis TaxID=2937440 RepID=A0ABT0HEP9_9BACT|nr:BamA/TamA family outer membrane protein [Spirosoma liriopis]MCK8490633.1 outer membrane protein assembly factor [Spirosoma liriopis]